MAGDWIKLEHATPDKPEVFRIAMDLGIPPEHVTGCLVRIWVWADVQTLDGNGVCVTGVTLDRIACYEGFAQAMQKVGWLIEKDGTYSFPNFDRHNGETAKTRALTAKRVAKHRNAKSVTPALPREEKRREEVNIIPPDGGTDLKADLFSLAKTVGIKPSMVGKAIKDIGEVEAYAALNQSNGTDNPTNAFAAGIRNRKAKIQKAEESARPVLNDPRRLSL